MALRIHENHDHLVEKHLDIADGNEKEVPEGENHERDEEHREVGDPKDGFVEGFWVLCGH